MPNDWLSLGGQTEILRRLAMQRERQDEAQAHAALLAAREYAALVDLATTESGQIFLETLVRGVLLRPCKDDVDRGRQHLVLEILHNMAEAVAKREVPLEKLHYEYAFGDINAPAGG
jgi:hypothetical protein